MTDSILAPVAALSLPDSAGLTARASQALAFVQSFEIASTEDYGLAADELRAIKVRANKLEEQRTSITGPINKALKAVNDLFRAPAEFLAQGERVLKSKMLAWDQEQERIAAIERRKAEEIAAAERRKLEEQAAEQRRQAEEQAALAQKAIAEGNAQAAQLAQANADRAHAQSQESATTAQLVTAAPITVDKAKASGISTSKKVDFEVVDLHALVKHVAANPQLLALVIADSVKLRAYVKGLGMACQLPGVRVYEDRVMSARAA